MKNISRRSFLKTGAVAAAGLTIVPGSVLGCLLYTSDAADD